MFGKKDAVTAIQSQSTGVMDIFTSTVTSLQSINERANVEIGARAEQIARLQDEATALDAQVVENDKVINKITDFLKD